MEILLIILLILVLLFGTCFFTIRNNKVYKFRRKLSRMCYEWNKRHLIEIVEGKEISAWEWAYDNLPDYDAMVFSNKPLELESWLTKDQLNKLTADLQ